MFDAAVPTDTASSTDWNPSRFADTSPLAGNLHALASESPALVGESPALVGESPTSAETSNEPDRAANVSAETKTQEISLETGPKTGPKTGENVSAETSADDPVNATVSPAPIRTARATVLENERGEVLNIGRRSRTVPRRIGHALRVRDGGCRFPGCGQPHALDHLKVPPGHRHPYPGQASQSTPSLIVAVPSPNQLAGDFWIGLRRRHASEAAMDGGRPAGPDA